PSRPTLCPYTPLFRSGGPDVVEAQRSGEPAGDIAPSPSRRRLLQADQVDVEVAQPLDRQGQPLIEVLAVTAKPEAAMEHVEGGEDRKSTRLNSSHQII